MNQQPDKLFREKLDAYQKTAPASAWEKIAAQSKKNDKWLWLKIAASVAFVAAAGYALLPENKTTDLSHNTAKEHEVKATEPPTREVEKSNDIRTESIIPSATPNDASTRIEKRNKKIETEAPSKDEVQRLPKLEEKTEKQDLLTEPKQLNKNVVMVETVIETPRDEPAINTEVEPISNDPKNITLIYTAKDVEEYLDKKSLAEATSDNKKSSTFKKLLKKANDLTSNQDPFGELRQKKNEILALNFKSEKQRGQNK